MSWFGRGSRADEPAPEKTDAFSGGTFADSASSGTNFASDIGSSPMSSSASSATSPEILQRLVLQEQQKALVQQVIAKLTEVSFDTCIDKPDNALTSRQQTCIHNVVGKYVETSEFVVGRTTKERS